MLTRNTESLINSNHAGLTNPEGGDTAIDYESNAYKPNSRGSLTRPNSSHADYQIQLAQLKKRQEFERHLICLLIARVKKTGRCDYPPLIHYLETAYEDAHGDLTQFFFSRSPVATYGSSALLTSSSRVQSRIHGTALPQGVSSTTPPRQTESSPIQWPNSTHGPAQAEVDLSDVQYLDPTPIESDSSAIGQSPIVLEPTIIQSKEEHVHLERNHTILRSPSPSSPPSFPQADHESFSATPSRSSRSSSSRFSNRQSRRESSLSQHSGNTSHNGSDVPRQKQARPSSTQSSPVQSSPVQSSSGRSQAIHPPQGQSSYFSSASFEVLTRELPDLRRSISAISQVGDDLVTHQSRSLPKPTLKRLCDCLSFLRLYSNELLNLVDQLRP